MTSMEEVTRKTYHRFEHLDHTKIAEMVVTNIKAAGHADEVLFKWALQQVEVIARSVVRDTEKKADEANKERSRKSRQQRERTDLWIISRQEMKNYRQLADSLISLYDGADQIRYGEATVDQLKQRRGAVETQIRGMAETADRLTRMIDIIQATGENTLDDALKGAKVQ